MRWRQGFRKCSNNASDAMSLPFFTVGHSTRTISEFVDLLRVGEVRLAIDIRTVPRSRTNPQYNEDTLGAGLAEYKIAHCRIAALGGLRKRVREVSPAVNGWWDNRSFHNYALSQEFRSGLKKLMALGPREAHSCDVL